MSMKELIDAICSASKPQIEEHFAHLDPPLQSIAWQGETITNLPSLMGPKAVTLVGDALEFYNLFDGGTNVYPWERWCGATELANPVRSVWDDVKRFDPLTEPQSSRAHDPSFLELAVQRATGVTKMDLIDLDLQLFELGYADETGLPGNSAITLFGYEMLEHAHHRICLFFPDAAGSEPVVLAPWDLNTISYPAHEPGLREFLEVRLSWLSEDKG